MQRAGVEIEVYSNLISLHIDEEDILVLKRTVQNKIAPLLLQISSRETLTRDCKYSPKLS